MTEGHIRTLSIWELHPGWVFQTSHAGMAPDPGRVAQIFRHPFSRSPCPDVRVMPFSSIFILCLPKIRGPEGPCIYDNGPLIKSRGRNFLSRRRQAYWQLNGMSCSAYWSHPDCCPWCESQTCSRRSRYPGITPPAASEECDKGSPPPLRKRHSGTALRGSAKPFLFFRSATGG